MGAAKECQFGFFFKCSAQRLPVFMASLSWHEKLPLGQGALQSGLGKGQYLALCLTYSSAPIAVLIQVLPRREDLMTAAWPPPPNVSCKREGGLHEGREGEQRWRWAAAVMIRSHRHYDPSHSETTATAATAKARQHGSAVNDNIFKWFLGITAEGPEEDVAYSNANSAALLKMLSQTGFGSLTIPSHPSHVESRNEIIQMCWFHDIIQLPASKSRNGVGKKHTHRRLLSAAHTCGLLAASGEFFNFLPEAGRCLVLLNTESGSSCFHEMSILSSLLCICGRRRASTLFTSAIWVRRSYS